jgi:hypothetical protein
VADVPGCLGDLDEVEPLTECPQNYPQVCVMPSVTVLVTNGRGRPRAVAVGFEPTVDFHPHTLSSSENPRSGTVARVRLVLNQAVRGGHRTRVDDDE